MKPLNTIEIENNLFEKISLSKEEVSVKPLVKSEQLMIIVDSLTTIGRVLNISKDKFSVQLVRPIIKSENSKAVIFRQIEKKWKIIGYGKVL